MTKLLIMLSAMAVFSCCTVTSKTSIDGNAVSDAGVKLQAQEVTDNCTTPHEAHGMPPQPVPGIPVMILRHAECLGQPNIVVAMWPGDKSRASLLYIELVIEMYRVHLKKSGEHFSVKLVDVDQVKIGEEETGDSVPVFVAVYKLLHETAEPAK